MNLVVRDFRSFISIHRLHQLVLLDHAQSTPSYYACSTQSASTPFGTVQSADLACLTSLTRSSTSRSRSPINRVSLAAPGDYQQALRPQPHLGVYPQRQFDKVQSRIRLCMLSRARPTREHTSADTNRSRNPPRFPHTDPEEASTILENNEK